MINQYVHTFCRKAKEAGIEKLKFYLEEELSRDLSVFQGELESLNRAELVQLFIEGQVDGKSGSVFVENLDESLMDDHIRCIRDSAESCQQAFIPYNLEGLGDHPAVDYRFSDLRETLDAMIHAEQTAYECDSRVRRDAQVHVSESFHRITLADDQEIFATDLVIGGGAGIHLNAQEGEDIHPGGKRLPLFGESLPDMDAMAVAAVGNAVSGLNASSVKTGSYPVVLDARVTAELLDAFMPAFFAKNVQSHMSVLDGKTGTEIVGTNISILEDPQLVKGFFARRFDDEGVLTTSKTIVDKGVLKCLLHSRQTAEAEGTTSGGNGFKDRFNVSVSVGYTNVYIPGGEKTRDQLVEQMGEGLLITSVSGVFAGAKPNSGDFSLISGGYRVENGKIGRGVNQITISGNFFEMLKHVVEVANDEHWMCTSTGNIRTPSMRISALTISGKE